MKDEDVLNMVKQQDSSRKKEHTSWMRRHSLLTTASMVILAAFLVFLQVTEHGWVVATTNLAFVILLINVTEHFHASLKAKRTERRVKKYVDDMQVEGMVGLLASLIDGPTFQESLCIVKNANYESMTEKELAEAYLDCHEWSEAMIQTLTAYTELAKEACDIKNGDST